MKHTTPSNSFLTTGGAARALKRSEETVRAYERDGRLPAARTSAGFRIFRSEDVEALRAQLDQESSR